MTTPRALSGIALSTLEQLLQAIETGRLACPITLSDFAACGFRGAAVDAAALFNELDESAVTFALRVAIAERVHRPPPRLNLVWTGPETRASVARGTSFVVEQLFASAQRSVIVGGYCFDTADMLRPLYRAMVDRPVSVTLFLDIQGTAATVEGGEAFANVFIDGFFRDVWTFGDPKPAVYYDPRTAIPGPPWTSLHAKCVVVDDERALITSANFTDRGHARNIETGVLVEDVAFAEELAGQWRQLVSEGLVRQYRS